MNNKNINMNYNKRTYTTNNDMLRETAIRLFKDKGYEEAIKECDNTLQSLKKQNIKSAVSNWNYIKTTVEFLEQTKPNESTNSTTQE
jgi:hypothetical protein